jgi:CHAT domain-containing protein/Flp pilus assembly protein TadD
VTEKTRYFARAAAVAIVAVTCLMLTGSPVPEPVIYRKKMIEIQVADARAMCSSGRCAAGLLTFQSALEAAQRNGDIDWRIKLESNIGSAYYTLSRYREAIQSFVAARKLARSTGRQTYAAVIDVNLASLYILIGDLDGADLVAAEALRTAGNSSFLGYHDKLIACLAELRAKQGRKSEAIAYFKEAARSAALTADTAFLARIWEHLGEFMLRSGDLPAAEEPLLEAFRLRKLSHDRDLRVSYLNLAWLRVEQGDLQSASALLQSAEAMPETDTGGPAWFVSFIKGRLAQKRGESKAALHSFGQAFQQALQWQQEVGPSDSLRAVSFAREELHRVYESLAEASLSLDHGQAIDAFEATEEYRAAALQQTLSYNPRLLEVMSPEYVSLSNRLREAQITELTSHSEANLALISSLRGNLAEIQTEHTTGPTKSFEKYSSGETLRSIQFSLRSDEALLSFYSGTSSTTLWAVTKTRIERHLLPSSARLQALSSQFRADIQKRRVSSASSTLYRALFQNLDSSILSRAAWIVSAADTVFSIPLAALEVDPGGDKPVYLVERHVLLYTASAVMLTAFKNRPENTRFVGLADGIYNSADSRWHSASHGLTFIGAANRKSVQLPRLVASGTEIDACASRWASADLPVLLKGRYASSESLETALRSHPAVLHMAVHVIAPNERPEEAAIALGLFPDGRPDILTRDDIAALDASNITVVISGCSSAGGPAVPGKGVLGLTRAWLLAGAEVVIGSRWSTPDDTGELFQSFYLHFRKRLGEPGRSRAAARSLREAQLDMLHSSTWRSSPWYWGAFYALGKE